MIAVGLANFIASKPREYLSAPVVTLALGLVLLGCGWMLLKKVKGERDSGG